MALADMQTRLKAVLGEMGTIDANTARTAEQDTRYNELVTEGYALKSQIESALKAGDLATWAGQSAGMLSLTGGQSGGATVDGIRAAGHTTIDREAGSLLVNSEGEGLLTDQQMKAMRDPEYARAFKAYLRGGEARLRSAHAIKIQEGLDPSGGFLVPEEILNRVLVKEPAPTRVAGRVTQMTTSRDTLVIPKVNYTTDNIYTSGMRVTWTGEVPASATAHRVTEPVWGQARIPIFTAMMSIPITNDQIEDTAFDLVAWISGKFNETILLLKENMALNGTGAGQPFGILANPNAADNPATTASGAAAALTWGGLQNILWAIPEQYEDKCCWVFSKASSGLAIASLVDGDGRPLWSAGVGDSGLLGSPKLRQLLGYEVVYSALMPNVGAGTYPIIFGDLAGYAQVNRVGFSIQVLREVYAESNQVVVLGRVRFGGLCIEPWRMRILVVSA